MSKSTFEQILELAIAELPPIDAEAGSLVTFRIVLHTWCISYPSAEPPIQTLAGQHNAKTIAGCPPATLRIIDQQMHPGIVALILQRRVFPPWNRLITYERSRLPNRTADFYFPEIDVPLLDFHRIDFKIPA